MTHSPFIVIDGTDGSGKGTQTVKLVERLRANGRRVESLDFPQYGKPCAYFVEKYLRGEYGTALEVGAKRASLFYALDRYDVSFDLRRHLANGTIVISDRYVSASKGHQMGKIADPRERRAFLDWLNELEYGILDVPKPDMTVLLHLPWQKGFELVAQKNARTYISGKTRDIHEADPEHLKAAEAAYLELVTVDRAENWKLVECMDGDRLLSIDEVHERLWNVVERFL